ncbi:MAG: hypothetical protein U0L49_00795 [Eubacterium sp.]|nr:hypothetical protein [Eubacterium sp.]
MNRNKRIHSNKKKYATRTAAIGMAALTGLTPVMATPVFAADDAEVTKDETVYVNASADGSASDITVSDHLSGNVSGKVKDSSNLKDIQNVKGDETYSGSGDSMTWEGAGTDIYYQGTSSADLPVSVKMTYYLDGKEISPEDLAGKSGKVKIKVEYINHTKKTVTINGEEKEVSSPFVMMTGMILPTENFTNVTVDNGKVLGDGSRSIVVGYGMPGLAESLDLEGMKDKITDTADSVKDSKKKVEDAKAESEEEEKDDEASEAEDEDNSSEKASDDDDTDDEAKLDDLKDKLDDFSIPEGFEVEADVTDFKLDSTYTVASNEKLGDYDIDDIDSLDDLDNAIASLKDATDQLVDGSQELADGTNTLNEKYAELNDGIFALETGSVTLKDGISQYTDGVSQVTAGAGKLNDGMQTANAGINTLAGSLPTLSSGVQQLDSGASQLAEGSTALKNGVNKYVDGTQEFVAGTQQYVNSVNQLNQLNAGIANLSSKMNDFDAKLNNANKSAAAVRDKDIKTTEENIEKLKNYYMQLNSQLTETQAEDAAKETVSKETTKQLQGQISAASDGAAQIMDGLKKLAASANSGAEVSTSDQPLNLDFTELNSQIDEAQANSVNAADAAAQAAADAVAANVAANTSTVDKAAISQQMTAQATQQATDQTNAALAAAQASVNAALTAEQAKGDAADQNIIASLQAAQAALNPTTVNVNISADSIPDSGSIDTEAVKASVKDAVSSQLNTAGNYDEIRTSVQELQAGASAAASSTSQQKSSSEDASTANASALQQTMTAASSLQNELNTMKELLNSNHTYADTATKALSTIEGGFPMTVDPKYSSVPAIKQANALQEQIAALNAQASSLSANYSIAMQGVLAQGGQKLMDASAGLTDPTAVAALKGGAAGVESGAKQLSAGLSQLNSNSAKLIAGVSQLQNGSQQLADGSRSLLAGLLKLNSNSAALKDGSSRLSDGLTTAADGSRQVSDGISELNDGAEKLADGTLKYKESGIDVLTDTLDDTIGNFKDIKANLDAVVSDDAQYTNYSGAADGMKTSVKFIIATDAVKVPDKE